MRVCLQFRTQTWFVYWTLQPTMRQVDYFINRFIDVYNATQVKKVYFFS